MTHQAPDGLDFSGHARGDAACAACATGHPLACRCGGLVHATEGDLRREEPLAVLCCDACGQDGGAMPPFLVDGGHHLPGRAGCPGCQPPGAAACRCGGLIHSSAAGGRRCDGCGTRWEELDI
jgi:hypothetical protein